MSGMWIYPKGIMILSILVYTFFSRMFDLMLPPAEKHSIVAAWSLEVAHRWRNISSCYSNSWWSISRWVFLTVLLSLCWDRNDHRGVPPWILPTCFRIWRYHDICRRHCSCFDECRIFRLLYDITRLYTGCLCHYYPEFGIIVIKDRNLLPKHS